MARARRVQLDQRPLHDRAIDPAALPWLSTAVTGLFAVGARHGLDIARLTAAPSAAELLRSRSSVAALYAPTLFASGMPLVVGGAIDYARLEQRAEQTGLAAAVDERLGSALLHELCHGRSRQAPPALTPWMVLEAAALHLGWAAAPQSVFSDGTTIALPGTAPFVMLGEALAARFGRRALWGLLLDEPLDGLGAPMATALRAAEWQLWLERRNAPFAYGDDPWRWIKLMESARDDHPMTLVEAERTAWAELPWWHEAPEAEDADRLSQAVASLFFVNRMVDGAFVTAAAEVPQARLCIEPAECRISALARPDGVTGEPASWLLPPPYARQLHERGARTITVENATRARAHELSARLLALLADTHPLPADWTLPF